MCIILQTYIDCLHMKKTDKSRMNREDPMDCDPSDVADGEGDSADFNEKVILPFFKFPLLVT